MTPHGIALILAALAAPLIALGPLASQHDPAAVLSQYLGIAALIAMGLAQVLATRWRPLETVFGGLARIYVLHKWLGFGAPAAVLLHETIGAEIRGLGPETALTDLGESLGEVGLNGFLVLIVLSIATVIPYHWWRASHKLMGAVFALSAAHYLLVAKPFAATDPLGLYVLGFCLLGIGSYIVTLLPASLRVRLSRRNRYAVDSVEETGGALAIDLAPEGRGLSHKPGQFAFVRFSGPGLGETHPFTISRAPEGNGRLRMTIKPLGDDTGRLMTRVRPGAAATVSGPFGRFLVPRGAKRQVWIAGGIGITPFLAWAGARRAGDPPVDLFFSVRSRAEAPHLEEIEACAAADPNLTLHLIETESGRRLDAAAISAALDGPLGDVQVAFCGPKPMREALRRGLMARGLERSRFHFEEFEIRSGIGLTRLASWLVGRIRMMVAGSPRKATAT